MTHAPIGLATLMRKAFARESLEPTAHALLERVRENAGDANALLDLSLISQLGGDSALGLDFQRMALSIQQHFRLQSSSDPQALKVLVLRSRGVLMDDMPIECLVEHSDVQVESLYLGQGIPAPAAIPDHDVAIVAVCESAANQRLLTDLDSLAACWPQPILNAPRCIAELGRDRLPRVVRHIDGMVAVESYRISGQELHDTGLSSVSPDRAATGGDWIIRPVSSHAGRGLERLGSQQDLRNYLQSNEGSQFYVAPFVDYQSRDGIFRKYRIALIQGRAFPVHMALSRHWMVHYLNADMLNSHKNRHEEAAFLQNFEQTFGTKHGKALATIAQRIGLDYVVIDCAETREGALLLFEADNGAVVHSMDPSDVFPYKLPAMKNVFDAFMRLLESKCPPDRRRRAA